jgi:trimeric autotransporter adhesin
MAIKASGSSLALSEIAAFWGGSQPHSLSEYYAGGSLVFSGAEDEAGNDIPSSGSALKISDFYSTHTITVATTDFTSSGTFTIPRGVSTLTITLYGAGGSGGEGDESGSGGGGGGGGSGGVVQGTLTLSDNVQTNPSVSYPQTVSVTVGEGGDAPSNGDKVSGGATAIVYLGQTTQASGGGHGGGHTNINGVAYSAGTTNSNTIGSNFSASVNATGTTADGNQAASGDGGSKAGTAGKSLPSNPLSLSSTAGIAGTLASNSAATGGDASGFGAGGGGAASIDRTGDHHWYGGAGAPGFVRIVVAS